MCRTAELKLPSALTAPSAARNWLRGLVGRWSLEPVADATALAVSELVTNAVLHGAGPVRVTAAVAGGSLEVTVSDRGGRLPREDLELLAHGEHGRGLQIVHAVTDEWGVEPDEPGKQVWFRLRLEEWSERDACRCPPGSSHRRAAGEAIRPVNMEVPADGGAALVDEATRWLRDR